MSEKNLQHRLDEKMQPLIGHDWSDTSVSHKKTCAILGDIGGDPEFLGELLHGLLDNENYLKRGEQDLVMEKHVLFNDSENGLRLRIHVTKPHEGGILHSHRMNFASYILIGGYEHTLFGPLDDGTELLDHRELHPVYMREENVGAPYYIEHDLIHNLSVIGSECISLMLRSPPQKHRAFHCEISTKRSWWRYGSMERTTESLVNCKPIERKQVVALVEKLEKLGIIS